MQILRDTLSSAVTPFKLFTDRFNGDQNDPMLAAIKKDQAWKVKELLQQGTNSLEMSKTRLSNGLLPLDYATELQRKKIVKILLKQGLNPAIPDLHLSPFDQAVKAGDKKLMKVMLKQNVKNYQIMAEDIREHFRISKQQLEKELDEEMSANYKKAANTPIEGVYPVEHCVLTKNDELLHKLILLGADLDCRRPNGDTLLHIAAKVENWQAARLLLSLGLDPNAFNEDGLSPCHIPAIHKSLNMLQMMVAFGGDPELKTKSENPELAHLSCLEIWKKVTNLTDPLSLNRADAWIFLSTVAYWLSVGLTKIDTTGYASYLPPALSALSLAVSVGMLGPKMDSWLKKGAAVAFYSALDRVPVIGLSLQVLRTYALGNRAWENLSTSYRYFNYEPWKVARNAVVHAVNLGDSLYRADRLLREALPVKPGTLMSIPYKYFCGYERLDQVCPEFNTLEQRIACVKNINLDWTRCSNLAQDFVSGLSGTGSYNDDCRIFMTYFHPDKHPPGASAERLELLSSIYKGVIDYCRTKRK